MSDNNHTTPSGMLKSNLLVRLLPAGSFARQVATLASGTTLAQVLLVLSSPILTRLYSPADFGVFALYTSVLSVLAVVACWRYELAIVLPEKDEDAANLLVLSLLITCGMSLFTLLLVACFRHRLASLLGSPELADWLWFMPLSLLSAGLFQALNYWCTRRHQFSCLAVRQVTQSVVTVSAQFGTGMALHSGAGGLIGGQVLGQLAASSRLAWQVWSEVKTHLFKSSSITQMKGVFVRFKDFPLVSVWTALLNAASVSVIPMMMGYFFSTTVVGHYSLAHRLLALPMTVIGSAVAQAFYPRAAEAYKQGELQSLAQKTMRRLFYLSIMPFILLILLAPDLFAFIFGQEWRIAGTYSRWLAFWLFFQFLSSPISTIYLVVEKQKFGLYFNIALITSRVLMIAIGGIIKNPEITVILVGLSGAVMYALFGVLLLRMAKCRASFGV